MKETFISYVFIFLGLFILLTGTELFIANKHFETYETTYQKSYGEDKEKFAKFYVFRLNNHFHGYFAKALGYPKNVELQAKSVEN
jgi:hypothetical protein